MVLLTELFVVSLTKEQSQGAGPTTSVIETAVCKLLGVSFTKSASLMQLYSKLLSLQFPH